MVRRVKLGDIEFSVVEEEKPRDMVTITDNPVESGQDVSDHVKQEPSIIDITGIMVGNDAASKLSKLKKYQKEGKLLPYIGRNHYANMAIETIDRSHSRGVKNGFEFNISLKSVRIATAKTVEIAVVSPVTKKASPKLNTKVKPKTNNGKQQPKTKASSPPKQQPKTKASPVKADINMSAMIKRDTTPGGSMKMIRGLYPTKNQARAKKEGITRV